MNIKFINFTLVKKKKNVEKVVQTQWKTKSN